MFHTEVGVQLLQFLNNDMLSHSDALRFHPYFLLSFLFVQTQLILAYSNEQIHPSTIPALVTTAVQTLSAIPNQRPRDVGENLEESLRPSPDSILSCDFRW